jgi:hypothetical protein
MERSVLLGRLEHMSQEPNPVLVEHARARAESVQNRLADQITAFAGSMRFVYIHVLWFGAWIGLGVEKYPYGLLTMIVSLEAIFLSTFVMISQNRADAKRQVIADQQWQTVKEEGQGEPRADQHLQSDSRTDEGDPRIHESGRRPMKRIARRNPTHRLRFGVAPNWARRPPVIEAGTTGCRGSPGTPGFLRGFPCGRCAG